MESLDKKISDLINPDWGKKQPLSEKDVKLIEECQKELSKLSDEQQSLFYANVISKEGQCGFASGGSYDYLLNTDRRNRYRVTIRTYWRSGIQSGQHDEAVIIEAGERLGLGCTDSGYIPVTYYSRQVVGEVKL